MPPSGQRMYRHVGTQSLATLGASPGSIPGFAPFDSSVVEQRFNTVCRGFDSRSKSRKGLCNNVVPGAAKPPSVWPGGGIAVRQPERKAH